MVTKKIQTYLFLPAYIYTIYMYDANTAAVELSQ